MKKALAHFKSTDPIMYDLVNVWSLSGNKLPTKTISKDYAKSLYSSIISQQISTKAAAAIKSRFFELVKDIDDPKKVLEIPQEELRSIGLSRQKASYIHSIAQHTLDKSVGFYILDTLSNQEVIDELVLIKGVGVWTAEMFLIFTLARPDVFSAGDLGLANAVKKHYSKLDVSKVELEQFSERWSPYKSIASLALWHSLDNTPK